MTTKGMAYNGGVLFPIYTDIILLYRRFYVAEHVLPKTIMDDIS